MTVIITSKNGKVIRLTDERWTHIIEGQGELAEMQARVLETVTEPERILEGRAGELIAIRAVEVGKWLIVMYRELEADGFIITAFLTRRIRSLNKRKQIWP
jgi:hypothetical protein